jgi:UDP-N-acetylenolpyruvoylglucosamine reductase
MKKIPTIFKNDVWCNEWIDYSTEEELIKTIPFLNNTTYIHVGGLSNVMFKENFYGTILHSNIKEIDIIDNRTLKVGSGLKVQEFIDFCLKNNIYISILPDIAGIPAEIGGIVVNNATRRDTIESAIIKVRAINMNTGEIKEFSKNECNFSYRKTIFRDVMNNPWAITYVYFKYYPVPNDEEKITQAIESRKRICLPSNQENGYSPCIFYMKNNTGEPISRYLQDPEIKQMTYNNVSMLSTFPYRFINNNNEASGNDAYILSEKVINAIKEKYGIIIQRETQFI